MSIFSKLKNLFGKLFGTSSCIQFDDALIQEHLNTFPKSLPCNYSVAIKEISDNIRQVINTANNKEFTIGVIGDFTVGKSSFINAILGDCILPVSANPSTAVITKIKYGKTPKVLVKYKEQNDVEMTYEEFLHFSAYNLSDFQERTSSGMIQRFKDITHAEMFVNSDFLKDNNLCIVDTLGLSAHEIDNKKTMASIREAIATIYICGERGLTMKDVDFISKYLNPEKEDFFLCVNRIDQVKKSERDNIIQLVELKLNNILSPKGDVKFPRNRIYLISSLYQKFANGFTDHEDWQKGFDYGACSGFSQIMGDVGEFVEANAATARKKFVANHMQNAQKQMSYLNNMRKDELRNDIKSCETNIISLTGNIQTISERIKYVKCLFETLYNILHGFMLDLFNDLSKSYNEGWDEIRNDAFVDQVSFDFRDYIALKKDYLNMQLLNVFGTMTDEKYSQFYSLHPFVELTMDYLKDRIQYVTNMLESKITNEVDNFVRHNSYPYSDTIRKISCNTIYRREYEEVRWAIYKAVAAAAMETTWIKDRNRRKKMFYAAKNEALRVVEQPLKSSIEQELIVIKQSLENWFDMVVKSDNDRISEINRQINILRQKITSIQSQIEEESTFFKKSIDSMQALCQDS